MAYSVLVERTVAAPRSKVYAALVDFGGINKLLPDAIESCKLEGSGIGANRHIVLKGQPGKVVERLEAAYDGHLFSYSIVAESPLPLEHYHAVVQLEDAPNGGTYIAYGSNWVAKGAPEAEVKAMLTGLYNAIIDALAK
jgi:uncharacterized protein YndB with AHSA1/START domain